MDKEYEEWTLEELTAKEDAMKNGGIEEYRSAYREMLAAQDVFLARVRALGLDPGYAGELFADCRSAVEGNDLKRMRDDAEECQALGKIVDMGSIGSGHAELHSPSVRIVQLSGVLLGFPQEG